MTSDASQGSRLNEKGGSSSVPDTDTQRISAGCTREQTVGCCQSSESRSRSVSRCIPKNSAVVHRHWRRGLASGQYSWGQNFYALQQARINELMARWFLLRGRMRELDTLDREQAGAEFYRSTGIRRESVRQRPSSCNACESSGLANLSCLARCLERAARRLALPACTISPAKKLDSWLAETAIRGRWRRAQDEGSVARRRFAGCKSAGSGRPSWRSTGAGGANGWLDSHCAG